MQPDGEREVAEMICGELHFVPAGRHRQLLDRHHPGVVDQDVQRPVPRPDEGVDAGEVAQVERGDPGGPADVRGHALTRGDVADRKRDLGTRVGERPRGLDADPRRGARDDRALAGEVDAVDDLARRSSRIRTGW